MVLGIIDRDRAFKMLPGGNKIAHPQECMAQSNLRVQYECLAATYRHLGATGLTQSLSANPHEIRVGLAGFEPATHGLGNRNRHFMACRDESPSKIFYHIMVRDVPLRVACCRPLWCQKLVSISLVATVRLPSPCRNGKPLEIGDNDSPLRLVLHKFGPLCTTRCRHAWPFPNSEHSSDCCMSASSWSGQSCVRPYIR